jgi:hypothetical protein
MRGSGFYKGDYSLYKACGSVLDGRSNYIELGFTLSTEVMTNAERASLFDGLNPFPTREKARKARAERSANTLREHRDTTRVLEYQMTLLNLSRVEYICDPRSSPSSNPSLTQTNHLSKCLLGGLSSGKSGKRLVNGGPCQNNRQAKSTD